MKTYLYCISANKSPLILQTAPLICVFMSSNYWVWRTRIHPSFSLQECSSKPKFRVSDCELDFARNDLRELPRIPLLGLRTSCSRSSGAGEVFPGAFLPSLVAHCHRFLVFNRQLQVSQRALGLMWTSSCSPQSLKDQDQVSEFDSWSASCLPSYWRLLLIISVHMKIFPLRNFKLGSDSLD